MFQKIIVIGSPGAGKSTFSRRLRDETGLPLYHLDLIWHKRDKTNIAAEEFDKKLNDILAEDKWIIDGNYQRTLEIRLKHCDTVFLLDYPLEVCLDGVSSRIGKKREDMPWVETEFDDEFREWITDFPLKKLPAIYEMIEKHGDKQVYIFKSRQEADEYLEKLKWTDFSLRKT
ncbi:MAG: adenylate kinase [Oscillospiraceae bacterium]|nr:adenylate kinase [Oscillospiraceae bacterium]